MTKGIEKIRVVKKSSIIIKKSDMDRFVTIKGNRLNNNGKKNESVSFKVKSWFPDTKEEDKKNGITWIISDTQRRVILKKYPKRNAELELEFKFSAELCGNHSYYIEASLSGKPDHKTERGMYVIGEYPEEIVNTKWMLNPKGQNIKNKKKSLRYGEKVYLEILTYGLNNKKINIEVYNRIPLVEDVLVFKSSTDIPVNQGKVLYEFNDTYNWFKKKKGMIQTDDYYIKVKNGIGKYILDEKNQSNHAVCLNFNNAITSTKAPEPNKNITLSTIEELSFDDTKHEPCHFLKFSVIENNFISEDGFYKVVNNHKYMLFDKSVNEKQKNKVNGRKMNEKVVRNIFFKFNSDIITDEGKRELESILYYLFSDELSYIQLDGYACVIGKEQYNKDLSERRAKKVKEYLISQKLDEKRIKTKGHGEINPTDDKNGRDNIRFKNESENVLARTVIISFEIKYLIDNTIIHETIASDKSLKRTVTLLIENRKVGGTNCYKSTKEKHNNNIIVLDSNLGKSVHSANEVKSQLYSNTENYNNSILVLTHNNIWQFLSPINNCRTLTYYFNSCRYFADKNIPALMLKVYPDVKWTFFFAIDCKNPITIRWSEVEDDENKLVRYVDSARYKELRREAQKMSVESRTNKKDVHLKVGFYAKWNRAAINKYQENFDFTYQWDSKFKWLFKLLSYFKNPSQNIADEVKGALTKKGSQIGNVKKEFRIVGPSLQLGANWYLERLRNDQTRRFEVGTVYNVFLSAEPFIGLVITIDLLEYVFKAGAGLLTGGASLAPGANMGVHVLYQRLHKLVNFNFSTDALSDVSEEKKIFSAEASSQMILELVLDGSIVGETEGTFNSINSDSNLMLKGGASIKVFLHGYVKVKGKVVIIGIIESSAKGEIEFKAITGISLGGQFSYRRKANKKGIYFKPELIFDGVEVSYVYCFDAGLSIFKVKFFSYNKEGQENIKIVDKFDLVEKASDALNINPEFCIYEPEV